MASKKEIDITAKIANLQKIRDELSKIKANIKVDSKDLTEIIKLAKKGLTIPVKFDVKIPKELKDLMNLQKNGITIPARGSGASSARPTSQQALNNSEVARLNQAFANAEKDRKASVDRQLKQLFAQQAAQFKQMQSLNGGFSPLVGGFKPGSFSPVNYAQAAKQAAFQSKFNQALQNNFNQANSPFFGGFGGSQVAFSRINPGAQIRQNNHFERIRKAQQRAADNLERANEFVRNNPLDALLGSDTRTVASKKFGVSRNAITARPNFFDPRRVFEGENFKEILYTTLLGGAGQGVGAALGAATFGKGGTLIGANIAQAAIAIFDKIAGSLQRATEAGAEYERAVTGITGIFQATSEIVGPGGSQLSIRQQLGVQAQRAEGIQRASQRALLPLGITGATGSALTQSLAAGLAQRGLAPDAKSTEILLRRFGASIQTLQPELASDPNLIRRGFEDIIGGGPQASRTELGSAIRGLAPGLFSKNIKSVDDILKATEALEELVTAIQNNDKATVSWRRALGSLELAQQDLGKGILEGIAPGLKAFADELQKVEVADGLRDLGKLIGELGSNLIRNAIPPLKGFIEEIQKIRQSLGFGDGRTGDEELEKLNAKRTVKGLTPFVRDDESGQLKEASAQQTIQSLLQTAKNRFGIEDPAQSASDAVNGSARNKLFGLNQLRTRLRGRQKSGEFTTEIGLNSQEIQIRRQIQAERNELFDDGDFGQRRRAIDEKGALRDQVKLAEDSVSKRKALLRIELAKDDKIEESIAQARLAVQKAEEEAIKLRNEVANKEKEIAERRLAIFQKELSAIDQTTFKGRGQALELTKTFNLNQGLDIGRQISAQQAIISSKTASPIEIQAAKDRLSELQIQQTSNESAKAQDVRTGRRLALDKAAFPLQNQNRREAAVDAARKSELELKQLGISTKELTIEQEKLARATAAANKALADFADQSRLRELGRQGEEIAAAEALVAAGGSVPAGISEALVRGSAGFDPEARAEFERQLAQEKFNQVSSQTAFDRSNDGSFGSQAKELAGNKAELALQQERLSLKPEELALQKRGILRDQRQQAIDNASAAATALEQDPDNPQLQQEYAQAYQKLQSAKQAVTDSEGLIPSVGGSAGARIKKKMGTFSINGEPVVPGSSASGMNISSGLAPDLIASNDIGGAILSGISGSAYGKAKETTDGAKAIGEGILKGLGADRDTPVNNKEVNEGRSIFDKLEAKLPSKQDMQDAFSAALQQNFA